MACILLVDPSDVARKAMHGILLRGKHRMAAVNTVGEAWDFIRRNIKVDLVFTEMALEGDNGLGLLKRMKQDAILKLLPVVVYAEGSEREHVRRALELHVQNYLIKPYRDEQIYGEIARALANPWRLQHFEEEKSFCKMMGLTAQELAKMLEALRLALEVEPPQLLRMRETGSARLVGEQLAALSARAEAAGAWGVVETLGGLAEKAEAESWSEFETGLDSLTVASRLIFRHLNPGLLPEDFLSRQEVNADSEARELAHWSTAATEGRCPVVPWTLLQQQIEALPGCPVIDSVAASFQMSASGHPASLAPLLDLVEKDPGLSAQLLMAANKVKVNEESDPTPIEDPRLAVGLLGELRLAALARSFPIAEERLMSVPPFFHWAQFRMFQLGTARTARFTCHYLELFSMESTAYVAGLLHDIGKLILLQLHPAGFQAVLRYAHERQVPLAEAERLYLGATTGEMAAHFAEQHGLPQPYINVMRWLDAPGQSPANTELVAVVSLARDLCRHNKVGECGDLPRGKLRLLEETPEWAVLRESVFPSFNLREFEHKVHAECRQLKLELYGRMAKSAVE